MHPLDYKDPSNTLCLKKSHKCFIMFVKRWQSKYNLLWLIHFRPINHEQIIVLPSKAALNFQGVWSREYLSEVVYTHHKWIPYCIIMPCLGWEVHGVTSWESCCSWVKWWKASIQNLSIGHSTDSHIAPSKSTCICKYNGIL